ncbi:MAG TPA: nuclear transport factor 2 family protein [Pilimelia sp.]|nr:nuclear transport factor 2 family protein [Pilimelia sp.]
MDHDTVRELADRVALGELVARLGRWLDDRDFDAAPAILTADAVADTPGGSARGRDRVVAQARANHHAGERTQHVFTDLLIDLAGDRAGIRANAALAFAPPDGPADRFMGTRYRFDATRTPDGWRLARIAVDPVWRAGAWPTTPPAPAAAPASAR